MAAAPEDKVTEFEAKKLPSIPSTGMNFALSFSYIDLLSAIDLRYVVVLHLQFPQQADL